MAISTTTTTTTTTKPSNLGKNPADYNYRAESGIWEFEQKPVESNGKDKLVFRQATKKRKFSVSKDFLKMESE